MNKYESLADEGALKVLRQVFNGDWWFVGPTIGMAAMDVISLVDKYRSLVRVRDESIVRLREEVEVLKVRLEDAQSQANACAEDVENLRIEKSDLVEAIEQIDARVDEIRSIVVAAVVRNGEAQ